jgi:hypothetical protein
MSGAPRGVRMVAQSIRAASWLNGSGSIPTAPRGAPLPLISNVRVEARAGEDACAGSFSPRGRRWQRAALTDEGGATLRMDDERWPEIIQRRAGPHPPLPGHLLPSKPAVAGFDTPSCPSRASPRWAGRISAEAPAPSCPKMLGSSLGMTATAPAKKAGVAAGLLIIRISAPLSGRRRRGCRPWCARRGRSRPR